MKTLYLNCGVGAAGDMLTAALLELMPDKAGAIAELNAIGIPNVVYGYETVTRCGIRGTHMSVKVNGVEESEAMHDHHHDHEHHHDHDHGEHHHHHTGLHGIEHIVRDHLNLPETVKEDVLAVYGMIAEAESHAHGVPPLPPPATAYLLQGIPAYSGDIKTELCTPTGAALLKRFVSRFGGMPVITTQAIGYGMGTKEFDAANCICAFWGETAE